MYLTATKLSGAAPALCSAAGAGCAAALGSSYSELLGAPLSAFGAAAYAGVAALAVRGALAAPGADSAALPWASQPRWPLLAGATSLLSVSGYLMAVLAGPLGGQACPYCFLSAVLSASAFAATARGFTTQELRAAIAPGMGLAAAVVLAVAVPQARPARRQGQMPHPSNPLCLRPSAQAQAARGGDDVDIPFREPQARPSRSHFAPYLRRLTLACSR